jgi:hypothetical protein
VSAISKTTDRVVIAIDPHKASWTAAVVDASSQPVATIRVPVSRDGYRALRRFADRWPDPTWAIEGASGLGAPLTARLRTDGIDVVDVPAKLAARVRMLSTGHGRKNDDADAVSVGIAAKRTQVEFRRTISLSRKPGRSIAAVIASLGRAAANCSSVAYNSATRRVSRSSRISVDIKRPYTLRTDLHSIAMDSMPSLSPRSMTTG